MATVTALLAQAEKHLGTPAALEPLAAAWREVPAVALLELIEKHDAAHPQPLWEGDYARAPAAARGSLLQTWVGQKLQATTTRLYAIAQWEADPRTSRVIEQLLRDVPYTSNDSRSRSCATQPSSRSRPSSRPAGSSAPATAPGCRRRWIGRSKAFRRRPLPSTRPTRRRSRRSRRG